MTTPSDTLQETKPARRNWLYILPAAIFALVGVLFVVALYSGDPSILPSALIGKPVPEFNLPPVEGLQTADGQPVPGLSRADFGSSNNKGEVTLVNVWASWCPPCHTEQPLLMRLKQAGAARMVGILYKDSDQGGRSFLGRYGNPFEAIGWDASGKAGIEWGVYKVPETFLVDASGKIVFKVAGPITEQNLANELLPAIEAARREASHQK